MLMLTVLLLGIDLMLFLTESTDGVTDNFTCIPVFVKLSSSWFFLVIVFSGVLTNVELIRVRILAMSSSQSNVTGILDREDLIRLISSTFKVTGISINAAVNSCLSFSTLI